MLYLQLRVLECLRKCAPMLSNSCAGRWRGLPECLGVYLALSVLRVLVYIAHSSDR